MMLAPSLRTSMRWGAENLNKIGLKDYSAARSTCSSKMAKAVITRTYGSGLTAQQELRFDRESENIIIKIKTTR